MKKRLRKIFMVVLVMCLIVTLTYVPTRVTADTTTAAFELNGATTIEGGVFQAAGGKAEISIAGTKQTGTGKEFSNVSLTDEIKIVLTADEGKKGVLRTGGGSGLTLPGPSTDNQITTYTFTLGSIGLTGEPGSNFAALNFEFEDNNPGAGDPLPGEGDPLPGEGDPLPGEGEETKNDWSLDLRIGSTEYNNIKGDSSYKISSMEDIKNITVLKQSKNGEAAVNVVNEIQSQTGDSSKSMSTTCLDKQGRAVLEVYTISEGTNYVILNLTSHYIDVGVDLEDFYVTNITFYVDGFKGMIVSSDTSEPDMFDSVSSSDIADLKNTTAEKPAEINKYYGSNTIGINGYAGTAVTNVALGEGINPNAVTISGTQVTFKSAYYASVPLVITLADGTTGYVTVNRLGVQISDYNANATNTNHGNQPGYTFTGTQYDGKYNIVANFYYDKTENYQNYNVVATLTYADGRTEVKTVAGVYESLCVDGETKGGDYIVYSGDKDSAPVKVSATVVKAGTSNTTFAGASFGTGKGVEFSRDTTR